MPAIAPNVAVIDRVVICGMAFGRGAAATNAEVEAVATRWYPSRMLRALVTLTSLLAAASAVSAQPVDPYAPAPTSKKKPRKPVVPAAPANAPEDPYGAEPAAPVGPSAPPVSAPPVGPSAPPVEAPPVEVRDAAMAERIATALVARAQALLDQRSFVDAKQLAQEALAQQPSAAVDAQARAIVRAANQQLGVTEDAPAPAPVPKPTEDVDTSPIGDAKPAPVAPLAEDGGIGQRMAARIYGGLYGGLLGATIGAFFDSDSPASGAVPVGLGLGLGGALMAPRLMDKLALTDAQVRTVGSAMGWGGLLGGLFADIAKTDGTSTREVLVGASVGATVLGAAGYGLARKATLTRGDVALIDTLAGIGAVGGLTVGMMMQPAESEAYSLNAALGTAGGLVVGWIAAPKTNTTRRRMARVSGLAALGAGIPMLIWASAGDDADIERLTGFLSTGGLLAGAYLGFRLTRNMDEGLDTLDGKRAKEPDDAPIALVGRSSSGRWAVGGIGVAPLSAKLAPQHGMALQLVGAAF